MRTPLVAGNWKMHKTLAEARALVRGVREGVEGLTGVEVLICPPFPFLLPLAKQLEGSAILLGAQNAHEERQGAFTGEVSVPMLADTGCSAGEEGPGGPGGRAQGDLLHRRDAR